jgi:uncharacterized DUF497 family protein
MRFEWDEDKNMRNIRKHGVNFAEAQFVFDDLAYVEEYDYKHSIDEDRWKIVGKARKLLRTIVTYPEYEVVRIISAKEATARDKRIYYGQNC